MLPSKGFFKKNDCPFFEKGLCVRPHCHFRHRKRMLNDHSPSRESDTIEDEEAAKELVNLISSCKQLSDVDKKPCSSSTLEGNELKDNHQGHDTLFAKLVNQNNSYGKLNKHIPCAYTPTPQTRNAELKPKSVSTVVGFVNTEKSLELITKARTLLQNYCAENIKRHENKSSGSCENKDKELNRSSEEGSSFADEQSVLVNNTQGVCNSSKQKGQGYTLKNLPSNDGAGEGGLEIKETTPAELMSDKNKQEGKGTAKSSNNASSTSVTSLQSETRQGESMSRSNVVPVEDSRGTIIVSCGSQTNDLSEINFVSSEIEMMKNLLKDERNDNTASIVGNEKCNSEERDKKSIRELEEEVKGASHSSSRHLSASAHYKSSKNHSSSRQSDSNSSRSSRSSSSSSRSHSSSRHHSSSKSHRSDSRSSSRHSSGNHKRGQSGKSEYESRRARHSIISHDRDYSGNRKHLESQMRSSSAGEEGEEEEEEEDDGKEILEGSMEVENDETEDPSSNVVSCVESEISSTSSRKRKNSDENNLFSPKYLNLSNFEDMEDDPDTVEKECLEIFNSYCNSVDSKVSTSSQELTVPSAEYESTVQGKKRTAHSSTVMADHSALRFKTVKKLHSIKSAKELMLERYKIVEKEKARESQAQGSQPGSMPVLGLNRPPVRIAAVSNIQQMLQAKKAIEEKISKGMKVNERTTIAHSVTQGGVRVAHVPKVSGLIEKPTITEGSKQIPRVKRQTYLDKLLVETNQIYPTKSESAEEALRLEQEIFQLHSGSTAAYHAAFVSLLMKTRRRVASVKGENKNLNTCKPKVSHFSILSGGKKNFSVIKTKKVDISMLSEKQIYEELLRCRLTPEELKENGFPIGCDKPGYATCTLNYELKYNEKYQYIKKTTGNRRYCIRCSKLYDVDPVTWEQRKEGPETCSYHPGRKKSGGRNCERVYNCCNTSTTEGCVTHIRHVTDCNDYENYPNCVRTLSKEEETFPGVYALDCEMVYTRLGTELARVTVVNLKKDVVYDTLVKPKYPIECYNTFYSGIEEKMMEGVETTLKDVQAVLLSMFSNKTILIGHSLDSDLRALHLIHDTVVDTSVVYKNERYHPYKYSLKDLCAKKISKIIQDNVNGHDSSEDAIAALEVMLQHIKEEVAKYDSLESYQADRGM